MENEINKRKELFKVKSHIQKVLPDAKSIDVRVKREGPRKYKSFIKVNIPLRRSLTAIKIDSDYKESLERGKKAIDKQVNKVKQKKFKKGQSSFKVFAA